jgi:hypothetical protein
LVPLHSTGFRKFIEMEIKKHKMWKSMTFWKHTVEIQIEDRDKVRSRDPDSSLR